MTVKHIRGDSDFNKAMSDVVEIMRHDFSGSRRQAIRSLPKMDLGLYRLAIRRSSQGTNICSDYVLAVEWFGNQGEYNQPSMKTLVLSAQLEACRRCSHVTRDHWRPIKALSISHA